MHHETARQTLRNGTGSLSEALGLVSSCSVWQVRWVLGGCDVVHERHVLDFNVLVRPFAEELDLVLYGRKLRVHGEKPLSLEG